MYKKIKDTENYYITSRGRVYRKWKHARFVELKTFPNQKGYTRVNIKIGDKYKQVFVHRLVVDAFLGEVKDGYAVNHIDGDKTNNNLENLEITTHSENSIHSAYALNNQVKKVLKLDVNNLKIISSYPSITKAAELNGINEQSIGKVCLEERKRAGGYTWCYAKDYSGNFVKKLRERLNRNNNNRPVMQIEKKYWETYICLRFYKRSEKNNRNYQRISCALRAIQTCGWIPLEIC